MDLIVAQPGATLPITPAVDCPLCRSCTLRPPGIILTVGVCRTPPVRGKGGAHLSRSCCGTHTDLSSAHDADTGALLKEVVRVHAELVPRSRQPRTATQAREGSDSRRARRRRGGARAHPGGSLGRRGAAATAQACRRAACRRPRGRLRVVAEARRRLPRTRRQGILRSRARTATLTRAQQLLASPHVRKRINDPMFDFGQRAAHIAAKNAAMLKMLIDAGADVNLKSDWENGPYTVLDNADEDTARFLLARGAKLTPNVAARLGWFDELRATGGRRRRARSRARRRRAAAAPRGEDRCDRRLPAGSRRRDRCALHRSQVDAGAVRAGRSSGRLPASARARGHARHLHGGPPRRRRLSQRACSTRIPPASPLASTSPAIRPFRRSTSTAGRSASACLRTTSR